VPRVFERVGHEKRHIDRHKRFSRRKAECVTQMRIPSAICPFGGSASFKGTQLERSRNAAAGPPDEGSHLDNTVRFIEFVIGDWLVYGDRFVVQLPLPVSRKSRAARIGGATRWHWSRPAATGSPCAISPTSAQRAVEVQDCVWQAASSVDCRQYHLVNTPDRTTAAAFPRYAAGDVLADSASLQWPGLYVRRYRFPRVVDRFLVPATPEPLISCGLAGSAEFRERELGETWVTRQIGRGDIFVTRSKTPYEVRFSSRVGEELEIIQVHVAVDQWLASLEAVYPGKGDEVDVIDFFGRDEALAYLCFACAEMLSAGTLGKSKRVADLTQLIASFLVRNTRTPPQRSRTFVVDCRFGSSAKWRTT
jgi:hypothetical protein